MIVHHIYRTAFGAQALGAASALALLLFVLLLMLRWPQLKLLGKQARNA